MPDVATDEMIRWRTDTESSELSYFHHTSRTCNALSAASDNLGTRPDGCVAVLQGIAVPGTSYLFILI